MPFLPAPSGLHPAPGFGLAGLSRFAELRATELHPVSIGLRFRPGRVKNGRIGGCQVILYGFNLF